MMRAFSLIIALILVCSASAAETTTQPTSNPTDLYRAQQDAFRQATNRVASSIVTIETIGGIQPIAAMTASGPAEPRKPGTPRGTRPRNPGANFFVGDGPTTGVIFSADGLILTSAFNFVLDPSVITVTLVDGRRFVGELLARDEVRQLAMVKIKADGLPVPEWIPQTQSDVRVGQWAVALGRGFGGTECSVSVGIISGLNRQSGLAVQTDAKLSPANYGGPLIDLDGRIIGISVPMGMFPGELAGVELYDSGIGFVIPFWQVARSVKDLQVGHSIRRGLMGIAIDRRVPDAIRVFGVADPSPAARAGMKEGDIIIGIDGHEVTVYPEMLKIMRARLAGEKIVVRVRRAKKELDLQLVLAVPEDLGDAPQPEPPPPPPATSQPDNEPPPNKPRKE